MLAELAQGGDIVLATGGGAVLAAGNRDAPARARHRRLPARGGRPTSGSARAHDRNRPLLRAGEPLATLERLLRRARPAVPGVADIDRRYRRRRAGQPRAQARAPAGRGQPGRGEAFGQPGARRLTWRVHADPDRRPGRAQLSDPHRRRDCSRARAHHRAALPQTRRRARHQRHRGAALRRGRCDRRWRERGASTIAIALPDGEQHKDWETLNGIFDALLASRAERRTTLVALGGGVVGDIAGFAAATYQRGVPFIQVPTTLLAQVDSSVGGKTGDQPSARQEHDRRVLPADRGRVADTDTLATLPRRELAAGHRRGGQVRRRSATPGSSTGSKRTSTRLVTREAEALAYAIERSCEIKAAIVARDERETGVRALLNFGHTFGHAIETAPGLRQLAARRGGRGGHGAGGAAVAAPGAHRRGRGRAHRRAARARRPAGRRPDLGVERYLELMGHDKKVAGRPHAFHPAEAPGRGLHFR